MTEIYIVQLVLPDARLVLQRRDLNAGISPGLLGFFGGHIEESESPEEAIRRELKEETSIDVGELNINYISSQNFLTHIVRMNRI